MFNDSRAVHLPRQGLNVQRTIINTHGLLSEICISQTKVFWMGLHQMVCRFCKISSWLYKSFDISSKTMFKRGRSQIKNFSKKNFDILSLHSMIETVEQNRVGFLEEVFHEYKSSPNFDIYDSKTTSFSVKLVEISGLVVIV
ncbi:unnamed protein product [Schistosoma rodhaini]|uniref:Uncharacterized protein n=1 Tax=Schistosoma rodhaini TaxID=6188 RepID=A0AA85FAY8_9TREM|nr:unnamed protein product [Schistosoma rodhaini]